MVELVGGGSVINGAHPGRIGQKFTKTNRNGHKPTKRDKNGRKRTEDRNGQKQKERGWGEGTHIHILTTN